ncbi:uncharacterized protein AKAW2_51430A [Aspergillus luchuensis]|uniref:Uncharacterized protein n=1 Tax=Aspergillus kawachii TaxID=1069201 RepID=A0A146FJB7_ASPKA|nr:uncharacterized protein AKAW2_51430A [Aspergillus luchuensis]BCS01089.1 hypothetical protein AKAW2_51430A [Aspergillus luchuensis]BCS12842.1 hypothetical protein ALUC_50888A [Aspergillus luchuensis]GAA82867.1 hypothetical protein AKAW_00982 [Aspergillus luchuensis IFO 4308]GAT25837.1 hypothetical protein RIB2604_02004160 [Aspergillus luchuensis]
MSIQDSDAESSISSQTRTKTPKHTFPLAHPPPKSTPCLRLSPRLLLQIQQLSITSNRHRALPILEIYQPPRQGKSLSNCPRKIHGRDLYILQSDAYTDITSTPKPSSSSEPPSSTYPIAAGVIYNNHNTNPKKSTTTTTPPTTTTTTTPEPEDEIYLPTTHQTYSATRTPRGNYRFILREKKTPSGETVIIEWRRKTQSQTRPRTASGSAVSGSTDSDTVTTTGNPCEEEGDSTTSSSDANANANANANPRFVLCVSAIGGERAAGADQRVRRSGLAGLEKMGLRVGGWDAKQVRFLEEVGILGAGGEEEVVTLVLTLGVYVAWMEGWL